MSDRHGSGALLAQSWPLLAPAILVSVIALGSTLGSGSLQQTVTMMLVNMVMVIGLYTFVGNSGVLSFGHVSFMGVGAYASALLTIPVAIRQVQLPDLPTFIAQTELLTTSAVFVAASIAAAIGFVVALPLMRLSGLPASIASFSLLLVVYTVIKQWRAVTAGPSVLGGMPLDTTVGSSCAWAVFAMALSYAFQVSRSGRRLRASREDTVAAQASGVRITRERVIAFTLSAFIVGIGGALYGHLLGSFDPNAFYLQATFLLMVMLVLGGINSLAGAVLGTMAVAMLLEILRRLEPGFSVGPIVVPALANLRELGLGALLVLVLTLRPGGVTNNREFVLPGAVSAKGTFPLLFGAMPARLPQGIEAEPASLLRAEEPGKNGSHRLEATGLSVHFGGVKALDGVDISLDRGEIVGLIGPNGAGKTTLINVLTGFQRATSGRTSLLGTDVTSWSPARLTQGGLSRTFQDVRLFAGLSAFENVSVAGLGVGLSNDEAGQQAIDLLSWLGLHQRYDDPVTVLTHAEARLVGIARALATRPAFVLLDEPAAGMSAEESDHLARLLEAIHEKFGCGLLIVEHNMRLVMTLSQRIQVLDYGKTLASGSPEAISANPTVIEAYLGRERKNADA